MIDIDDTDRTQTTSASTETRVYIRTIVMIVR